MMKGILRILVYTLKKHLKKYRYGLDHLFNESATLNHDTNVFKDAKKLFNEVIFYVKKQTKLETNFIKIKQSIIF